MAGEQPVATVIVGEPVAAKLANHLHQQGRLRGGVRMVIDSLNKAVDRKWGVAADSFKDSAGPGWIIDVSDYFDNELLYAIVRSENGIRSVVAVVDEDEIGEFKKTGKWVSPEAAAGGLSEVVEMLGDQSIPDVPDAPAPRSFPKLVPSDPQPDDPRLIVWWEGLPDKQDDTGRVGTEPPKSVHTTYGDAQRVVMKLLMRDCKVEVWSGVKHPELKVDI